MNAKEIKRIASAWAEVMRENQTFLVELDSVAGDGDIGMVLSDGFAMTGEHKYQTRPGAGGLFRKPGIAPPAGYRPGR